MGNNRKKRNSLFKSYIFLLLVIFYFLFTIVMKVLISCTENPKKFIEVLDELELFIDKKSDF
jgi:hypothetical protein